MNRTLLCLLTGLTMLCGCSPTFDPTPYLELNQNYDVVIERDIRGVPHVIGKRDVDVAFGLAYAQAEDHWRMMQETIPFYRGTNAKYQGQDAAVMDFLVRWLGIWQRLDQRYEADLSRATRDYLAAFADGMNFYAAHHPEQTTGDFFPVSGKDIAAGYMLRHVLFYGLDGVIRELTADSRQQPVSEPLSALYGDLPIGSNGIAVAPHYSEDGATRLLINSHQPTTGPVAWYEAHLKSDQGLNILGGLFPGSPTISLGFNQHLGWAVTVNKPDLADVYVLDIDPDDPMRYRLDGQWHTLEQTPVTLEVNLWGWLPWKVERTVLRSEHGPVLQTDHGTYAVRFAGMNEIRQVEQWFKMNKAQDFRQWRNAMRMHSFSSFNFVYADALGNTMFVHNSQTPQRSGGYNWQQYLPGDQRNLIWQEYMPFDTLPSVINPASGYVISANQSPFAVSGTGDNPNPDSYLPQDGFPSRMTNRAHRGLQLLDELGPISADEFFAIKHDKQYAANSRAAAQIRKVADLTLPADSAERYQRAQKMVAAWDLNTDVDNTEAALGVCIVSGEWLSEQQGRSEPDALNELQRCTDLMLNSVGRLDPPWGEVNRHVRGSVNVPVGGGPDTLRAIYGRGLEEQGYLTNVAGDGLYYLVSWDKAGQLQALGTHHFGSATLDESSPHFADQAADYAAEQLHDPLYDDQRRSQHLQRRYRPGDP